jgi:hypothetical protein
VQSRGLEDEGSEVEEEGAVVGSCDEVASVGWFPDAVVDVCSWGSAWASASMACSFASIMLILSIAHT